MTRFGLGNGEAHFSPPVTHRYRDMARQASILSGAHMACRLVSWESIVLRSPWQSPIMTLSNDRTRGAWARYQFWASIMYRCVARCDNTLWPIPPSSFVSDGP